jgi:hypothetical protein
VGAKPSLGSSSISAHQQHLPFAANILPAVGPLGDTREQCALMRVRAASGVALGRQFCSTDPSLLEKRSRLRRRQREAIERLLSRAESVLLMLFDRQCRKIIVFG